MTRAWYGKTRLVRVVSLSLGACHRDEVVGQLAVTGRTQNAHMAILGNHTRWVKCDGNEVKAKGLMNTDGVAYVNMPC